MSEAQASLQARFAAALDRLVPEGRLGVAVSGGPDSLALLILAAEARPGMVEAATVDHALRAENADEAALVGKHCARLGIPHAILKVAVEQGASLQAQARNARYSALCGWAEARALSVLATAHHADDQAETLLMRLARGSGLGGLAGVREQRALSETVRLVRPLLEARKSELRAIVETAGLHPVDDPANADPRHERTRARSLLGSAPWLDAQRVARSARALEEAEQALAFAVEAMAAERLTLGPALAVLRVGDLPAEFQRRLLLKGIAVFGVSEPRGGDIERALVILREGRRCTLGGISLTGGERWTLAPAPPRRA